VGHSHFLDFREVANPCRRIPTSTGRKALASLLTAGKIGRISEGRKGNQFRYFMARL
jgi:hypothetical protein